MANLLPNVFVCSDQPARLPELIAGARKLGNDVSILCVGTAEDAKAVACLGANTVYHFAKSENQLIEDYALSFAKTIKEAGPKALLLLPSSKRCKAIAAKLGVMLEASVVNDVSSVVVEGDVVTATTMIYGGLALRTEKLTSAYAVTTVSSGVYDADAAATTCAESIVVEGVFVAPAFPIKLISSKAKEGSSVDLSKAKRVVCVGRGFGEKEALFLANDLAKSIGAEVGCTRPIAEGAGWMEHERYIGVSGVMLHPDVYIALGISGQIQHMVGANSAKKIIAVNKDKNAPIFNFVDYGLVGDLYKVLPVLACKLKGQ